MPNRIVLILLFLSVLLGTFLRVGNISEYKFYPDSYHALLLAENIKEYGGVVGKFGSDGMSYPDFFNLTRPLYSVLIILFQNPLVINLVFSVGSIILAFIFLRKLFNSDVAGLVGAFLLALSFNHTVWTGFIMTESLGIFLVLLSLTILFYRKDHSSELLDVWDLVLGVVFALAVLARYEYILVIVPFAFFIFSHKITPWTKLVNIGLSSFLIFSITAYFLRPWPYNWGQLFVDFSQIFWMILVAAMVALLAVTLKYKINLNHKNFIIINIIISTIILLGLIGTAMFIPGFREFTRYDFLLVTLAVIGLFALALQGEHTKLFWLIVSSCIVLGIAYVNINPLQQRYWTHLIPFLLIAAVAGFNYLWQKQKFIVLPLGVLCIVQIVFTSQGLKNWHDGVWQKAGYEEVAALEVSKKISGEDLLLASFPEPYYYFTRRSTYSLNDNSPYIYIPDSLSDRDIVIVSDNGLIDQFPNFYKLTEERLQNYKYDQFHTGAKYRYQTRVEDEKQPVKLYRLKLKELVRIIETN